MGIRKDRTIGDMPGKAGRTNRKNHQEVAQRHGASGQVWHQGKFTYSTATPELPMATPRKGIRHKAARLLAFRE